MKYLPVLNCLDWSNFDFDIALSINPIVICTRTKHVHVEDMKLN